MQELVSKLAKQIQNKYYGKYRGFVVDNADPEQRGRLRLKVPSILGEAETAWALPCLPFGGLKDQGLFTIPEIDAQVWVEFEEGELSHPIWVGTFWQKQGDAPVELEEDPPTQRSLKTPAGHLLMFEDAEDKESFRLEHPKGAKLEIDPEGTVTVTDAEGATMTLDAENGKITVEDSNGNQLTMDSSGTKVEDANGHQIEMAASGVTVKGTQIELDGDMVNLAGGGEPVIKGQSFISLYMTHTHPSAMGPTGPPIPQGEMNSLSKKVMTG